MTSRSSSSSSAPDRDGAVEFHVEDHPDPHDVEFLEAQIRRHASAAMGLGDEVELAIFVREAGEVVAGISGWTWGDCCELQSLWVHPRLTGRWLGIQLIAAAEAEAAARGCTQTVHFTYDFQARRLYERAGYELVARVEDFPSGADVLLVPQAPEPTAGLGGLGSLDCQARSPVIEVKVSGRTVVMRRVAARLDGARGVHHVVLSDAYRPGFAVVRADAEHAAVDDLVAAMRALGIAAPDLVLTRAEEFGTAVTRGGDSAFVWTDVAGLAGSNARLAGRYLIFMVVAGVIAGYGVIGRSPILIVGAMAVSPDLLPVTAIAVGLVAQRLRLTARALLALVAGMTTAALSAAVTIALVNAAGAIPPGPSRRASASTTPSCTD